MIELDSGSVAGSKSTGGLVGRLAWLYLAAVLGLVTLAYLAFISVAHRIAFNPSPVWQFLLWLSCGMIGAIPAWFAGTAYVRNCRRSNIRPGAFALRWLGGLLAIAMLVGLAFLGSARLLR